MPKIIGKTIKATIISIIVALFITALCLLCVKLFAGAQINDVITIANRVSIETPKNLEHKETVINNETKVIQNYPKYGSNYATIEIPKIDVNLPVYFGDTLEILKKGVGHSSGSYFPGEGGSIIFMGHNSVNVFRRFGELQIGNEITVKTTYGEYKYKIYDMQLVNETESDKLPIQKEKEILMVYTCYPFANIGHATQRYVVFAERIE
ncbi:MAG: class D sortase [Clostridia bacterium]|nr:class D sortase [Clostridia bacterium]